MVKVNRARIDWYIVALAMILSCVCGCGHKAMPLATTRALIDEVAVALATFTRDGGCLSTDENARIMRILGGKEPVANPQQIVYFSAPPSERNWPYFDKNGRLLDGWGIPVIFRLSIDGNQLAITSCGPNRKDDRGVGDDMCEVITLASPAKKVQGGVQ